MTSYAAEALGFDTSRLARIEPYLQKRYIDSGVLPHCQLLIARDGQIAHFSHQGSARDGGKPIDETSLFRIASMTKPITSVAFMMLVEQGKVALDTPVHRILPEFKNLTVMTGGKLGAFETRPTSQPMRMVDLLRHTSGLTYGFQERTAIDAAYRELRLERWHGGLTLDEFVAELGKLPLEFSPGDEWNYSVSTDVLGAVIQRLSGQSLDAFFREQIFAPLGMDDTFFSVPAEKLDRLTDCYTLTPKGERIMYDTGEDSAWANPPTQISGGGGLISTSLDYHRFCRMCLNGGTLDGARIVGRKTLDLMTRNHLPNDSDLSTMSQSLFSETTNAGTGFGLGFAVTKDVAKTLLPGSEGEYYWGGMFSTAFFIDPVERLHMVFMTQVSPSSAFTVRRELKTLIYSALT
ncbi:MAG: beta-lactamase family protein [Sphingomonas sp.]|uniref:serine hydrolase domain-containing protein n=1 Tax=Sphingomonas sp. TaxID=28214 RepID=UPI0025FB2EE1|nr:serine hydrolase domain-containing protein [Sphingomonas sp.]MBX3564705.1 beta-lactamase family protein [Sphingomonas sp.]